MNFDKGCHLNEKQIILAMIDEAELSLALQEHLYSCPECRASKERFEQELARLGQMAEFFAPGPKKQVFLPAKKTWNAIGFFWNWRAWLGVAATAACVIIAVWWYGLTRVTLEGGVGIPAQESWEADPLMTEINILVENALPQVYIDISGEYDSVLEEEFMQFFVPPINNDSLSFDPGRKGEKLC